jgi:hypothetical protein
MLLDKEITIKWSNMTKKHYESLGYVFKYMGELKIPIEHLYENSNHEVNIKCDYCGKNFTKRYCVYIKGKNTGKDACKKCSGKKISENLLKDNSLLDKFPELAKEFSNENNESPNEIYCYSRNRYLWVCNKGHKYEATPDDRIKHNINCPRCPKNRDSFGERKINEFLKSNNIFFEKQYYFKNLLSENGNPLKYDFAIFKDNKLYCLIEFDGRQHFEPVFGEDVFNITVNRDNLKNAYCKNNNIKLIRIEYWNLKNIRNILQNIME